MRLFTFIITKIKENPKVRLMSILLLGWKPNLQTTICFGIVFKFISFICYYLFYEFSLCCGMVGWAYLPDNTKYQPSEAARCSVIKLLGIGLYQNIKLHRIFLNQAKIFKNQKHSGVLFYCWAGMNCPLKTVINQ